MFLVKCLQGKISSLKWDFKSVSYLLSLCIKTPLDVPIRSAGLPNR